MDRDWRLRREAGNEFWCELSSALVLYILFLIPL